VGRWKLTAGVSRLELGWEGVRRVARVGAGVIRRFLEGHTQEVVGVVVHGKICSCGCAESVPAHWCVRFGGSFLGVKGEAIGKERRQTTWTR